MQRHRRSRALKEASGQHKGPRINCRSSSSSRGGTQSGSSPLWPLPEVCARVVQSYDAGDNEDEGELAGSTNRLRTYAQEDHDVAAVLSERHGASVLNLPVGAVHQSGDGLLEGGRGQLRVGLRVEEADGGGEA